MPEAEQLPVATPTVGANYNYGGDNYVVTRFEPNHFLVQDTEGDWVDAVEFTDVVGEGETATIKYVVTAEVFEHYHEGLIDEDAEIDNSLPETPEPKE